MIGQREKKSFEKKRFRNEEQIHRNKKRKDNEKKIKKLIIQKSSRLSLKCISNDFSLLFAKTIVILNRIFNSTQYSNSRARQLSNEVKEMRQQYQTKRMTKLI
jgi:hypothetical protein